MENKWGGRAPGCQGETSVLLGNLGHHFIPQDGKQRPRVGLGRKMSRLGHAERTLGKVIHSIRLLGVL